jgi:hypothetical protein
VSQPERYGTAYQLDDLIKDWLAKATAPFSPQAVRIVYHQCAEELRIVLEQGRELPTRPMSEAPPKPEGA